MSTRKERANRWWMRCLNCGEWRGSVKGKRSAGHFDPWTKTYLCSPSPSAAHPLSRAEGGQSSPSKGIAPDDVVDPAADVVR